MAENQLRKVSVPKKKYLPSLNFESGYGPVFPLLRAYLDFITNRLMLVEKRKTGRKTAEGEYIPK